MANQRDEELAEFARDLCRAIGRLPDDLADVMPMVRLIAARDSRRLRPFEDLLKLWAPEEQTCDRGAERNQPPSRLHTIYASKAAVWGSCTRELKATIATVRNGDTDDAAPSSGRQ